MTIKVPFEILMNIQTNVNGIQTRRDKKKSKRSFTRVTLERFLGQVMIQLRNYITVLVSSRRGEGGER